MASLPLALGWPRSPRWDPPSVELRVRVRVSPQCEGGGAVMASPRELEAIGVPEDNIELESRL